MRRLAGKITLVLSILLFPVSIYGQGLKRVAVMPFQLHGLQELSYLRESMIDMLSSRIGSYGKFDIVDKSLLLSLLKKGDGPIEVGREVGADYIVLGGMTRLGNSLSLDVKVVDTKGATVTHAFATARELGEVIPKVEELAVAVLIDDEVPFVRKAKSAVYFFKF